MVKRANKSISAVNSQERRLKKARTETQANKSKSFPAAMSVATTCPLLENMINAASSVPMAYPDTQNPYSHTIHHRLITTLTATTTNQPIVMIASPDPSNALGISDGLTVADPLVFEGQWKAGYNAQFSSQWQGVADPNFGGLPWTTNRATLQSSASNIWNFQSAGTQFPVTIPTGAVSVNSPFGVTFVSGQLSMINPNGAANLTLVIQTSVDGGTNWTDRGTQTQLEASTMAISFVTANTTDRFFRVQIATDTPASASVSRTISEMSLSLATNARGGVLWTSVTSLPTLQGNVKAFRPVAMNVLVTNMSSDLNNGGELTGVQLAGGTTLADETPNFANISSLPNAYNGALQDGLWGFWSSEDTSDRVFRILQPQVDSVPPNQSYPTLAMAGIVAAVGGSVRIQLDLIVEYTTVNEAFAPIPSRVNPEEIMLAAKTLAMYPCHFCANDFHKKAQVMLRSAASGIITALRKYGPYVVEAAKFAAPIAAALI